MYDKTLGQTTFFQQESIAVSNNAVVTIFDGAAKPIEINLARYGRDIVYFGREERNDIVIRSQFASRQHGYFRFIDGAWAIENNPASTNGLLFNGHRVEYKVLEDGDNIRIDNNQEPSAVGVLIVFSTSGEAGWQNFSMQGKHEVTIGRENNCDIVLEHISISKQHARIVLRNNTYYVMDNNSTNGIIVNGRRVTGGTRLREKDTIIITNSVLIFSSSMISYRCYKSGISVEAFKITKRVAKDKIICDGVDLRIEPGELMTIVGGSGAGKTTVMNCLSGYSQPTSGSVLVNNLDLYQNFDALKNVIGYVPQSDIVYDNLTVYDMLHYAAELRLPRDMSDTERQRSIHDVIEKVELTANKDTLIKNLSGGQRKRASIAVELLSDPNLFFLDEPASGLDPGTERNLMLTLRKMAAAGKTVIFVTHSTLNLHLCDKIAFMGRGGKLCYYGSYNDALAFFGVTDIVDVYNLINNNSEGWEARYNSMRVQSPSTVMPSPAIKKSSDKGLLTGGATLVKRNLHILKNDRTRLLLILAQAPLLALLISFVSDGYQFDEYRITRSLLFALSCSAFWIGIMNSIQEICKERNILKREYMAGLRLDSYLFSKLIVLGVVCAVQSFMLVTVFALLIGLPNYGVVFGAYPEFLFATFLISLSASAMGIFVSSLFTNADRAMTVAPLLLMPQLLFSGMIFELDGIANVISYAVISRWSMMSYGSTANLNTLSSVTTGGQRMMMPYSDFYTHTPFHLLSTWVILIFFIALFSGLAVLVLRNINNEYKK